MKYLVILAFLMALPSILCRTISGKDPEAKDLVEPPLLNNLPKGYFFTYEYAPILRIVNEDLGPEGNRAKRDMPDDSTSTDKQDDSNESLPDDNDNNKTVRIENRRFLPNTK